MNHSFIHRKNKQMWFHMKCFAVTLGSNFIQLLNHLQTLTKKANQQKIK